MSCVLFVIYPIAVAEKMMIGTSKVFREARGPQNPTTNFSLVLISCRFSFFVKSRSIYSSFTMPKAVTQVTGGGKTSVLPKAKTPILSEKSLAQIRTRAGSKTQAVSEQDEAKMLQCSGREEIYFTRL